MTPEENLILKSIGQTVILRTAEIVALILMYGLFLPLTVIVPLQLRRRGLQHKENKGFLGLTLFLYLLFTSLVAVQVGGYVLWVKESLTKNFSLSLADRLTVANNVTKPMMDYLNWPAAFHIILANGFIVWRAWGVWAESQCVKFSLGLLMFTHIVLSLYTASLEDVNRVSIANITLSLVVNLVTTTFIFASSWVQNRIPKVFEKSKTESIPGKLLYLLTESGVVFSILQLMVLILLALTFQESAKLSPTSPLTLVTQTVYMVYVGAAASYPMAVVSIIKMRRSHLQEYPPEEVKPGNDQQNEGTPTRHVLTTLRFASDVSGTNHSHSVHQTQTVHSPEDGDSIHQSDDEKGVKEKTGLTSILKVS